jgi:UPF0288 family protein (methanogenesis marker protein 3)
MSQIETTAWRRRTLISLSTLRNGLRIERRPWDKRNLGVISVRRVGTDAGVRLGI